MITTAFWLCNRVWSFRYADWPSDRGVRPRRSSTFSFVTITRRLAIPAMRLTNPWVCSWADFELKPPLPSLVQLRLGETLAMFTIGVDWQRGRGDSKSNWRSTWKWTCVEFIAITECLETISNFIWNAWKLYDMLGDAKWLLNVLGDAQRHSMTLGDAQRHLLPELSETLSNY